MTRNQDKEKSQMKILIKETVQELLSDEVFLNTIIRSFSDKIKSITDQLKNAEDKVNKLEKELDNIQQKAKLNNVCIYGIKEEKNEKLKMRITQLINTQSNQELVDDNIDQCYRIGKQGVKPRPVIIKFKLPEHKEYLMKNTRGFKGKNIFITEDLTHARRKLLQEAISKFGNRNAWPLNGNIFANIEGRKTRIHDCNELLKYPKQTEKSSMELPEENPTEASFS